ncbi:unnamed protein product, partial [Pseudo-nitzschia multistriata]
DEAATGSEGGGSDSDSDGDDSDWEGAPRRRRGNPGAQKSRAGTTEAGTPARDTDGETPRRQTRVRSSLWKCTSCGFENHASNKECVACDVPKPGCFPDLE